VGEQRRAPGEVKQLILDAAAELFAAQGYSRTSLREISIKAGVAESMIFRGFGSKAELFKKTVHEPFQRHLEEYAQQWQAQIDRRVPDEEIVRLFVTGLYDLAIDNRRLLLALMAVNQFDEDGALVDFDFNDVLDEQEKIFEVEAAARGFPAQNFALVTRSTVGAIIGAGLLDPWLMPKGVKRPTRGEIIEELITLCSTAIMRRDPKPGRRHTGG
jgi:AcrR family transcriptional regulator